MTYVEEFRSQLASRDHSKVIQLWHEYCQGDLVDGQEIIAILQQIKLSDFSKPFGQYVEAILPLALMIQDEQVRIDALRLIFDLQTTNSEALYHIAMEVLKTRFSSDPGFSEKMRLVGMRNRDNFQGALSNFILLNHIQKGHFVLHTAGWGIGEIIDFSFLREQVSIEFENLQGGKKEISFKNAFKTLLPISKTHFLARRFATPDILEKEAKENPVEIIRSLLSDLGPKTASEIKDLLVDIVILEEDYSKWWQQARSKIKKDPLIESPDNPKLSFELRQGHASTEERLKKAFAGKKTFQDILQATNNLVRDFPEVLKATQVKEELATKIKGLVLSPNIPQAELVQALLFLEQCLGITEQQEALKNLILGLGQSAIDHITGQIELLSLKKRLLTVIQAYRSDWTDLFLHLLFTVEPNQLRDFILKELSLPATLNALLKKLHELLQHPQRYPEALFWYFQKVIDGDDIHFQSIENKGQFFEAFLILFSSLDFKPDARDLSKKMYGLLTNNRFEIIRAFFKEAPIDFVQEFLLLASKCQGFSSHDQKILVSLAEVAHPKLAKEKKVASHDLHIIWTTQEGYSRTHERIKHIGTLEIVDNAREIETARAHGDLRENAEYKAAIERRNRLQSELKMLSDQFRHARIITKEDIDPESVGVGSKVELISTKGEKSSYTILGPWDANPDLSILSFQSKFAQALLGKKVGDTFSFKNEEFKISSLKNYLEK